MPIGFDHLCSAPLRMPAEAGLYNHAPIPLPAIRIYAPIELGKRTFRTGAAEEESVRVKAKIPKSMIDQAAAATSNNNTADEPSKSDSAVNKMNVKSDSATITEDAPISASK